MNSILSVQLATIVFPSASQPLVVSEDIFIHTEFTRHDSQTGLDTFGLSFTTQTGETQYLLPVNSPQKRIGWSRNLQYPFLMVPPNEMKLVDLDKAKTKYCKCC